jgi:hypothetical protein
MGMTKKIQAKHIADNLIYVIIEELYKKTGMTMINRWEIGKLLPGYPEKIVLAKLRNMVESGKLWGCGCGCRGDFSRRYPDKPRF